MSLFSVEVAAIKRAHCQFLFAYEIILNLLVLWLCIEPVECCVMVCFIGYDHRIHDYYTFSMKFMFYIFTYKTFLCEFIVIFEPCLDPLLLIHARYKTIILTKIKIQLKLKKDGDSSFF